MTTEEANNILDAALEKIGEHFDAVQICATTHSGSEGTSLFVRGDGNFYARKAACAKFIESDTAEDAARILRRINEED